MNWNPSWANAIASIESQGSGGYSAVGPITQKGNRAYGKYQVMDFNIPAWTEKHLGQELTTKQFLQSPEAQDAVFKGEFGSYVSKYGNPQDAASAWFTGQPQSKGSNKSDVLGTTGSGYVNKFNNALGTGATSTGGPQMMQPKQQPPKGLLGSLGIQKMEEGAEGDAGERFYNRKSFGNTLASLAPALGRMGVMGLEVPAQAVANRRFANQKEASDEAKSIAQRNKTAEFLAANGRKDLAGLVSQGIMSGSDAAKVITTATKDTSTSAMKNYNEYQRILAEKGPEAAKQFLSTIKSGGVTVNTGDSSLYGKAPEGSVWAKDAEGQHIMEETAPGSGKFRPSVLTLEGSNPETRAAKLAETERKRIVNADSAFDAITLIDEIYKDPSLPSVTGMIQGRLPALSQDGTDLVVKIDQLKGKAFLQAFETLKGGGQITEREGLAATKAIARLERQQGPEAYRESLKALRSVVERVRKRALGQEVPEYSDEEFEAIIGNLPAIPESSNVSPQKTKTGVTYKVIGGSDG
jgi:hypothetical protein